jgi:hypothetical protein
MFRTLRSPDIHPKVVQHSALCGIAHIYGTIDNAFNISAICSCQYQANCFVYYTTKNAQNYWVSELCPDFFRNSTWLVNTAFRKLDLSVFRWREGDICSVGPLRPNLLVQSQNWEYFSLKAAISCWSVEYLYWTKTFVACFQALLQLLRWQIKAGFETYHVTRSRFELNFSIPCPYSWGYPAAGRSRVPDPKRWMQFFFSINLILSATLGPWVYSTLTEMSTRSR